MRIPMYAFYKKTIASLKRTLFRIRRKLLRIATLWNGWILRSFYRERKPGISRPRKALYLFFLNLSALAGDGLRHHRVSAAALRKYSLAPYTDQPETRHIRRPSYPFLAKKILMNDVISLDVFDTLLLRPFDDPKTLFYLVGEKLRCPSFFRYRVLAEKEPREAKQQQTGPDEVTLIEICQRLNRYVIVDPAFGASVEMEIEPELCMPHPYLKQVYDMAVNMGKTVIAVTDMYLPASCIRRMLEKCGYHPDALFVSNAYGVSKRQGGLYQIVRDAYPGKRILHFGDNYTADIRRAGENGIGTVFMRSVSSYGNGHRPWDMTDLVGSAYRGIVNNKLCSGTCRASAYYEFGYAYAGLLVLGYCQFLHRKAKSESIDKVLFLSRDGDIFKQVYDRLYPGENTEYFYWSRAAATLLTAGAFRHEYILRYVKYKISRKIPVKEMCAAMDLPEMTERLHRTGIEPGTILSRENYDAILDVLLLSDIHRNSAAYLERYRQAGIFDEVFLLPEAEVTDFARSLDRRKIPSSLVGKLCCRMIKKRLPVPLTGKDELFLCPDHFPLGWYVVTSQKPYVCFEEGCGVLSDRGFALTNMSRNRTQRKLFDKLRLFGDNDLYTKVLADTQKQAPGYQNPKMADFSVDRILQQLPQDKRDRVLALFGCQKLSLGTSSGLILTQHMANLGLMTLPQQRRLYTLFADLLLPGMHPVIKPHPDDIAGCYHTLFPDADVLPFSMPSELLPYCTDAVFDKAVAAYSTAVRSLGPCVKTAVSFDKRTLTDYPYLLSYYAASRVLALLANAGDSIATNAKELLLAELCGASYTFTSLSSPADILVLSDRQEGSPEFFQSFRAECGSGGRPKVVLFLQEDSRHLYYDGKDPSVFRHVRPVFADGTDGSRHTVYVYCQEDSVLERVNAMNEKKELKYTGITVDLHGIDSSEREKIRVLEGILEATEKRLLDCLRENGNKERAVS